MSTYFKDKGSSKLDSSTRIPELILLLGLQVTKAIQLSGRLPSARPTAILLAAESYGRYQLVLLGDRNMLNVNNMLRVVERRTQC